MGDGQRGARGAERRCEWQAASERLCSRRRAASVAYQAGSGSTLAPCSCSRVLDRSPYASLTRSPPCHRRIDAIESASSARHTNRRAFRYWPWRWQRGRDVSDLPRHRSGAIHIPCSPSSPSSPCHRPSIPQASKNTPQLSARVVSRSALAHHRIGSSLGPDPREWRGLHHHHRCLHAAWRLPCCCCCWL